MTVEKTERLSALEEFRRDFPAVWKTIPYKGVFVSLLVLWVLLFEFLGNSTFGYINTHSLFGWTSYAYLTHEDDKHGFFIPFIVLALLWWKRSDLQSVQARPWIWGLGLVALALFLHIAGYLAQQTRISLAAFYFGLYALFGVVWGPAVLRATFFPMCLFVFALPLGTLAESITLPLRLFTTSLTCGIADNVLGIHVIRSGVILMDQSGSFKYEIAAACSGLRSITAVLALCTIFAFINFKRLRNRLVMLLAAIPLAILGNLTRLLLIIMAAEGFGQKAGNWIHDSSIFSLLPYLPPIIGIIVLGHIFHEQSPSERVEKPVIQPRGELPATS
jgi:exosortase